MKVARVSDQILEAKCILEVKRPVLETSGSQYTDSHEVPRSPNNISDKLAISTPLS